MEKHFKKGNILVTGGAGFVGSNLVDKLVQFGARVTVLDDLFTGDIEHLRYFEEIDFVHGSVTDKSLLERIIKKVDIVFHLAARNIIASTKNPCEDLETNVVGTFNVLEAARINEIERVVYSSSASVYGNSRYLPINEDDPLYILNPYAASKLAGENYCMAFYETFEVPVTVLRYSNVYGFNQSPKNPYCGVIAKFLKNARKGRPPQIHGDGEQTRDFSFVSDVVDATMLAAISPKAEGEVYNVGTGKETSINELAEVIINLTGNSFDPVYIDRRDIDNLRRRVLNIEKIRKDLKWIPETTLKKGLEKTYQWFQKVESLEKMEKKAVEQVM
jgi:UDP-glucose 4-epimerase